MRRPLTAAERDAGVLPSIARADAVSLAVALAAQDDILGGLHPR